MLAAWRLALLGRALPVSSGPVLAIIPILTVTSVMTFWTGGAITTLWTRIPLSSGPVMGWTVIGWTVMGWTVMGWLALEGFAAAFAERLATGPFIRFAARFTARFTTGPVGVPVETLVVSVVKLLTELFVGLFERARRVLRRRVGGPILRI